MDKNWKRKSWVTQGADPTEVVKWTYVGSPKVEITEFQNVYLCEVNGKDSSEETLTLLATKTHQLLEAEYQEEESQKIPLDAHIKW